MIDDPNLERDWAEFVAAGRDSTTHSCDWHVVLKANDDFEKPMTADTHDKIINECVESLRARLRAEFRAGNCVIGWGPNDVATAGKAGG